VTVSWQQPPVDNDKNESRSTTPSEKQFSLSLNEWNAANLILTAFVSFKKS
jgi:hypothetical protein